MNPENQSSKQREDKKTEELEKQVNNLKKVIELQQKTIDHDKKFGHYEMM